MKIELDQHDLRPLVQTIIDEVLDRIEAAQMMLPNNRLAYPEAEAAAILGVAPHILRDCRLRKEIDGSKVGKRIVYERNELASFLIRQKVK